MWPPHNAQGESPSTCGIYRRSEGGHTGCQCCDLHCSARARLRTVAGLWPVSFRFVAKRFVSFRFVSSRSGLPAPLAIGIALDPYHRSMSNERIHTRLSWLEALLVERAITPKRGTTAAEDLEIYIARYWGDFDDLTKGYFRTAFTDGRTNR